VGGFGLETATFAMDGIRSVAPVAVLLAFAVVYFGVMNDAGLFTPIIGRVLRVVGRDPLKVTIGTAAIATLAHLDGAGASTFMVTVPAMLPIYRGLRMDPLLLTCTTALAAGTMNILPWGGPTIRAATSLRVTTGELFLPLVPAMVIGLIAVFAIAAHLGMRERRRLAALPDDPPVGAVLDRDVLPAVAADEPARASRPGRWTFNLILTLVVLASLFSQLIPLAIVFVVASALALIVNYPDPAQQRERLVAHGAAAMMMVTTIFAAGVFTGVLTASGMLNALSSDLVAVLPDAVLRHLSVAVAVASMPLSLAFDPDSFYFGLLPIVATAAEAAAGSAVEVGRAAVLGQMTTGFPVSPLTPSSFLLVGLAGVDFADHQRRTIPWAFLVTLIMTAAALVTGAIGWR
jgi:CitMHS family citrate-Mg2+:H+ or citrate-Ca2+:H+ symporter